MAVPSWFEEISLDDVKDLVSDEVPDGFEENRAFYDGDHWQDGDGWIGPFPDETAGRDTKQAAKKEIRKAFTSKNVVSEIVDRHAGGVLGASPLWRLIPTDEEDLDDEGNPSDELEGEIEEKEALLSEWWDDRDVDAILEAAVANVLLGSRAALRLFVPRGLLSEGSDGSTVVPSGDVEDQLERIYLDDLTPEVAIVWEDSDTRKELSIVVYKVDTGDPTKSGTGQTVDRAELSWVEDDGETTVRILQENEEEQQFSLDFGGRLTVRELERPELVTEQVRQQQKALNLANSMIPRNVTTGGFLERILLNAQVPGKMVQDEDTGEKKYQAEPLTFGPATVNVVRGIELEDAEGNEKVTTPQIEYRDPVSPGPSAEAKESHYEDILEEVDQAHVAISGDATASGRSREQARAEFERSLERTATPVEDAVRWLISTVLSMAEAFASENGEGDRLLDSVRVDVTVPLETGPISAEEMNVIASLVEEGLMSRETGLQRVGIDDVEAEIDQIDAQEARELEIATKRAQAIITYVRAGADIRTAALAVGMDEERADELFEELGEAQRSRAAQEGAFRDRVSGSLESGASSGGEEAG